MLSLEPIGYTYRADLLCPNCTIEALKAAGIAELYDGADEETIRILANRARIDYSDSWSYDSDDFPKPVLSIDIDCTDETGHEQCGACGTYLCGYTS